VSDQSYLITNKAQFITTYLSGTGKAMIGKRAFFISRLCEMGDTGRGKNADLLIATASRTVARCLQNRRGFTCLFILHIHQGRISPYIKIRVFIL
jgi:hypothetical protein